MYADASHIYNQTFPQHQPFAFSPWAHSALDLCRTLSQIVHFSLPCLIQVLESITFSMRPSWIIYSPCSFPALLFSNVLLLPDLLYVTPAYLMVAFTTCRMEAHRASIFDCLMHCCSPSPWNRSWNIITLNKYLINEWIKQAVRSWWFCLRI